MDLKGKLQSSGWDIREKAGDIKDNIANKLNDLMDQKK